MLCGVTDFQHKSSLKTTSQIIGQENAPATLQRLDCDWDHDSVFDQDADCVGEWKVGGYVGGLARTKWFAHAF